MQGAGSGAATGYFGTGGSAVGNATFAGNFVIGTQSASPVVVATSDVGRLMIDASGNTAPYADNAYSCGKSSNRFTAVYAVTGTIQTSDVREKTAIVDSSLGLDFINTLRPVSYKWRVGSNEVTAVPDGFENVVISEAYTDESGTEHPAIIEMRPKFREVITPKPGKRTHYGLIAQEVKAALTAAGCDDFAGYIKTDVSDPDSLEGLRYDQFIAPLIRAVQELSNGNSVLAARVAVLEAR